LVPIDEWGWRLRPIDYNNPNVVYATTQNLDINKSMSGTRGTFASANSGIPNESTEPRQFIAPLVMDPTVSTRLYAGTTRLYRSLNSAASWTAISPIIDPTPDRFGAISAIGPAPSNPNKLYVGTGRGTVKYTDDGGANWNIGAGLPTSRFITDIKVHAKDPNTAWLTLSGFRFGVIGGNVYKTTNGGANWTNASSGLPNAPVNAIAVDMPNPSILYVGTDVGVYKSADGGQNWTNISSGLPNTIVNDLILHRNGSRLYAFTHGRGVYISDRTNFAVLAGSVRDQRVDSPPSIHKLHLEVSLYVPVANPVPGTTIVGTPYTVITETDGSFLLTGLPSGTFDVRVKDRQGISVEKKLLILGSGGTLIQDFGVLHSGDANNSDDVSAGDFTVLKQTFGQALPCATQHPVPGDCADFDANGTVSPNDFSILKQNFLMQGPFILP
jgi:hypothetical protein